MQFSNPDPAYMGAHKTRRNFLLALKWSLIFAAALWFIWIADAYLGLDLRRFGLRPRELKGLLGILTAPLIHGSGEHLFANTTPLIVSFTAILYLYPNSALRVIPMLWVGSGLLAWLIGRPSVHIGASGLIYGVLAFVFVSGVLRQDLRSIGVSLAVWFLYGSMVWGVLPIKPQMSWEMHLSGAILGVAMALVYRNFDQVPIKRYEWEDDDTVPDWYVDASRELERQKDEGDAD